MRPEELQRITLQFQEAVNLDADELEAWLRTDESQSVGFTPAGRGESVGHASGRRIVELLRSGGARTRYDAAQQTRVDLAKRGRR